MQQYKVFEVIFIKIWSTVAAFEQIYMMQTYIGGNKYLY